MFSVDQQLVTNRIQRFFEALAQKHNIEWDGEILNSSEHGDGVTYPASRWGIVPCSWVSLDILG